MQHPHAPQLAALESRAEANDSEAQLELARLLDASRDGERAAYWLRRSAELGNVSAGALLGAWLLLGYNLKQDESAGVARLVDAATRGDDAACAFLATLHASGLAAPHDWGMTTRWLIAAAKLGNDRAQTQLALLVSATEKELRARLLFAAATRGNAIASYFLGKALLDMDRPDARVAAGLWLGIAAAAGNPCALRLVSPSAGSAQLPPAPTFDEAFWSRVNDAVDVQSLLAAPEVTLQRQDPTLLTASRILPTALCEYLIGIAAPLLQRAEVNDALGEARVQDMRTNSHARFGITNTDVVGVLAARRASQVIREPFENQEDTMVLRYRPGETYGEHYDFVDPRVTQFQRELALQGQRVATVLIYLNEEYVGGETDFPQLGWRYRGAPGDALAFRNVTAAGAPDVRMLHAGRPPSTGEKWLLSKWVRDRRQLGQLFS
jgi:prolyl 4-hydroxylase